MKPTPPGYGESTVASQFVEVLRSRFCRTLTLQEAEHIANATVPRRLQPNARICHQGDPTAGLIFLLHGTAEIVKENAPTGDQVVARVAGPMILGEISLLTGDATSATVRALTDCECYVLTRAQYQRLLESQSLATYKLVVSIAELLARKLTAMNDKIIAAARQ